MYQKSFFNNYPPPKIENCDYLFDVIDRNKNVDPDSRNSVLCARLSSEIVMNSVKNGSAVNARLYQQNV